MSDVIIIRLEELKNARELKEEVSFSNITRKAASVRTNSEERKQLGSLCGSREEFKSCSSDKLKFLCT